MTEAETYSLDSPHRHVKLAHAFDPASGAPLSTDREYHPDHTAVPCRTPVPHPSVDVDWSTREGALTNGELRSDQQGLKGFFRRVHRDARDDPAPGMDSAAALAIKRLKAANEHAIDAFVWLALAERLASKGYWAGWMLDHFTPRCPHCTSVLKFRDGVWRSEGICASAPSDHGTVDEAIRERIAELYLAAFDEDLDPIFV